MSMNSFTACSEVHSGRRKERRRQQGKRATKRHQDKGLAHRTYSNEFEKLNELISNDM